MSSTRYSNKPHVFRQHSSISNGCLCQRFLSLYSKTLELHLQKVSLWVTISMTLSLELINSFYFWTLSNRLSYMIYFFTFFIHVSQCFVRALQTCMESVIINPLSASVALICYANQLTGFYMKATVAFIRLKKEKTKHEIRKVMTKS